MREWFLETSYRAWLLLAFLAPASLVFQRIWALTWRHVERRRWLRVEVDSLHSKTLFHAVADRIDSAAETCSATCSSDMEAFVEYDKATACSQVPLRYWGTRSQHLLVHLLGTGGPRAMLVHYDRGDDIAVGRGQQRVTPERLVLRCCRPASGYVLTDPPNI